MVQKVDKLELVLKKMAQVLAANTKYAAMISGPSYHKTKLKFIQLSRVEAHKLLVVVVVEGNIVKNTMIDIAEELGEQELLNLNIQMCIRDSTYTYEYDEAGNRTFAKKEKLYSYLDAWQIRNQWRKIFGYWLY